MSLLVMILVAASVGQPKAGIGSFAAGDACRFLVPCTAVVFVFAAALVIDAVAACCHSMTFATGDW